MNKKEFQFNENSFDILRMVGAYIVILSHSFRWLDMEKPAYLSFLTNGSVGVMMFFAITGFMIMPAYERTIRRGGKKSLIYFFWNRIIRIYPALLFSFVIISVVDVVLMGENILTPQYVIYAIKYCVFARGGGYGVNGISNGVLWTITADILYYLLTPIVYKLLHNKNSFVWCIVIFLFWLLNLFDTKIIAICQGIPVIGAHIDESFAICFIYEFLIGSFMYFKREKLLYFFVNNKKYITMAFIGFLVYYTIWDITSLIPKTYAMHAPQMTLVVCPLTIIMGYAFGKHRIKHEISYGLFMYHILVVQCLKYFSIGGYLGICMVVVITTFVALVSKRFIEDPCLRLKKK